MKSRDLILLSITASFAMACGSSPAITPGALPPAPLVDSSLHYEFTDIHCTTGPQDALSLKDYCAKLQNNDVNQNCALIPRYADFNLKCKKEGYLWWPFQKCEVQVFYAAGLQPDQSPQEAPLADLTFCGSDEHSFISSVPGNPGQPKALIPDAHGKAVYITPIYGNNTSAEEISFSLSAFDERHQERPLATVTPRKKFAINLDDHQFRFSCEDTWACPLKVRTHSGPR